jgi:uncharacterized phage-associated protein
MVFFAQNGRIKNPSKMMMYKLIAVLDFRHFQATGLPVTNLRYKADRLGPVPEAFHEEITKNEDLILPKDFEDALTVQDTMFEKENGEKCPGFKYIARRKPNLKVFSPRQQAIMEDIVTMYKDATATEASDASHEPGTPWAITVAKHGKGAIIDLIETLELEKPLTKEMAQERLREREAFIYNYGE